MDNSSEKNQTSMMDLIDGITKELKEINESHSKMYLNLGKFKEPKAKISEIELKVKEKFDEFNYKLDEAYEKKRNENEEIKELAMRILRNLEG
ncbi:hypothetical protein [Priestia megaterium]|uniref:hypothetical protein n=1 Tax=Priestia megaterium TaxID=1404 RepID=UPI00203AC539|nr:hypothetical protein [Priestia megaterium]MCM3546583.1 hypothetical protein [Priestia megaterium]